MTLHTAPPRPTRVVLRLPAGMSVREALAAQIEALINRDLVGELKAILDRPRTHILTRPDNQAATPLVQP